MDENPKPKNSWWQTLPGVLTATAGTATAIAGLIGALHQAGLFKSSSGVDQSIPKISDESKREKSSAPSSSLIGSWVGSPSCLVVFYLDDGKNVEGSCDVGGYRHKIFGTHDDLTNIGITISRTDPNGCVTNVRGFIRIVSRDSIEMGQNGWNGCGVTTESVTTSLSRK